MTFVFLFFCKRKEYMVIIFRKPKGYRLVTSLDEMKH